MLSYFHEAGGISNPFPDKSERIERACEGTPGESASRCASRGIIDTFCQECRRINAALLAMIAGRLPVFLVPNPVLPVSQLQDYYSVRIFWNEKGWYLRSQGTNLFSFDLPPDLFEYYAEQGVLSSTHALNLKEDVFSEIQGILIVNDRFRIVRFSLDQEWLSSVRNRIRQIRLTER